MTPSLKIKRHVAKKTFKAIIDFLIKKNGKTAGLEVKADYRINKTGNFFFEAGT